MRDAERRREMLRAGEPALVGSDLPPAFARDFLLADNGLGLTSNLTRAGVQVNCCEFNPGWEQRSVSKLQEYNNFLP